MHLFILIQTSMFICVFYVFNKCLEVFVSDANTSFAY